MKDKEIELEFETLDGEKFYRIFPEDINTSTMRKVRKANNFVAFQVRGKNIVVNRNIGGDHNFSTAHDGDWILFDLLTAAGNTKLEKLLYCEKHIVSDKDFKAEHGAYNDAEHVKEMNFSKDEIKKIFSKISTEEDGSEFSDYSFIDTSFKYSYVGMAVYAASVPFNFVIQDPLGNDAYVRKNGVVIYDPNRSSVKGKYLFAINGEHNRIAGQFENSYIVEDAQRRGLIKDRFKEIIRADRSPMPGIQFNMVDLKKAYELAGKEAHPNLQLEKY